MSLFQVTKKQVIENYELRTMTGDIVSFTPSYSQLLPDPFSDLNVAVNIVATGGNGTPDNPNPINGYTEANITRCGKNYIDIDAWLTSLNVAHTATNGVVEFTSNLKTYDNPLVFSDTDIPVTINARTIEGTATVVRIQLLNSSDTVVAEIRNNTTLTATANACKLRVDYSTGGTIIVDNPIVYDNGQTYTITFGQTVYGGVPDVTRGKLTVTWTNAVDLGSLGWSYDTAQQVFVSTDFVGYKNGTPFLCDVYTDLGAVAISQITNYGGTLRGAALYIKNTDYTDAPTFKTAMSGKYITAELGTPFDIDLTPEVISAIVGENNVFADCGETTVTCLI